MTDATKDQFADLPQVVDIAGDRYFFGAEKPVELAYKTRKEFKNAFDGTGKTEQLIRTYLYYNPLVDLKKRKLKGNDKADLIKILETRAKKLKESKEFTSSTLKNMIIQRFYLNTLELLEELRDSLVNNNAKTENTQNKIIDESCKDADTVIQKLNELDEYKKYRLIIEIAWYLLHTDKIPNDDTKCDFTRLIKKMDTFRLTDAVNTKSQSSTNSKPINYFKKFNLENVGKAATVNTIFNEIQRGIDEIDDDDAKNKMRERLEKLLTLLELKKYLSSPAVPNVINNDGKMKRLSDILITNPEKAISGGALEIPLGNALMPLFDYFKIVYDPVYSVLDTSITSYFKSSDNKITISQMAQLLHICSNLNPSEMNTGGQHTYGVYRITNVDEDVMKLIQYMMASTKSHVNGLTDDKTKNLFNKQVFSLPKVRLTSLLNKFENVLTYKDPDSIPYIQFVTIGGNMTLPGDDSKNPEVVNDAIKEFFVPTDLYIVCTKSENSSEDIPMNVYQIDYSTVNVTEKGLVVEGLSDNYFNKNKGEFLDTIVSLEPYVKFNDAELALSIFIAMKELMPK